MFAITSSLVRFLFLLAFTNQPLTIYGDGKKTWSFCCITDTLTRLILYMANSTKGEVGNVGNTKEVDFLINFYHSLLNNFLHVVLLTMVSHGLFFKSLRVVSKTLP